MSEQGKSLLVVKSEKGLSRDVRQKLLDALAPATELAGLVPVVLDEGLDAGVHADIAPTLRDMLAEQKQTNKLLMLLIQALADEDDPDEAPTRGSVKRQLLHGYQPKAGPAPASPPRKP